MKKFVTAFLFAVMMAISVPFLAETANAQTRYVRTRNGRVVAYKKPNIYRRHRKAFNIGIGTGLGMLVGGLVGGKKGLVIGGLAGAGGGALVTHKQRPKNYYRRVYRRY
jgi:outer membrane lipoprotein SlyB